MKITIIFFSDDKSSKQTQHFTLLLLGYADRISTATEAVDVFMNLKQIHTEVPAIPICDMSILLSLAKSFFVLTLVLIDLLTR